MVMECTVTMVDGVLVCIWGVCIMDMGFYVLSNGILSSLFILLVPEHALSCHPSHVIKQHLEVITLLDYYSCLFFLSQTNL